MPSPLVVKFVALIVTAACTVALCKRLGLSPIIGYLLAGLIIGPHGTGLLAPNEGTEFLSELGVVQMTRKRIGEGLLESFASSCPECEGRGVVLDPAMLDG